MGMNVVQDGKDAAWSFSGFPCIVEGTANLLKCREILEGEGGSAMSPEQRNGLIEELEELEQWRDELEQQYIRFLNCIFKRSDDQASSEESSDLYRLLITIATHLTDNAPEEAEHKLSSACTNSAAAALVPGVANDHTHEVANHHTPS
ncbi:hypothetical protein D9619_001210 [Psilocybe cf. subviscida]|uniref:Uncharacterized protein n=1 Tax=Psilocybe cf. subviscida TaxID=2480587 RepID=A0A8H5BEH2_9AGAR|nr:hypothetical protein D9619_001210 [Psilocybe cf. subviscida]